MIEFILLLSFFFSIGIVSILMNTGGFELSKYNKKIEDYEKTISLERNKY